jgi:Spy/CpxP family protein refolding chaperone
MRRACWQKPVTGWLAILLLGATGASPAQSPYAGEESREIKSLSPAEVEGLLAGSGMGFAKAAELNGYPGPRHVLDLADELELTDDQRAATQALFDAMHEEASRLGAELVAEERMLDALFAEDTIDHEKLAAALTRIGELRTALRRAHLEAHLRQKKVLSASQVHRYMRLRGYHTQHHAAHHDHAE